MHRLPIECLVRMKKKNKNVRQFFRKFYYTSHLCEETNLHRQQSFVNFDVHFQGRTRKQRVNLQCAPHNCIAVITGRCMIFILLFQFSCLGSRVKFQWKDRMHELNKKSHFRKRQLLPSHSLVKTKVFVLCNKCRRFYDRSCCVNVRVLCFFFNCVVLLSCLSGKAIPFCCEVDRLRPTSGWPHPTDSWPAGVYLLLIIQVWWLEWELWSKAWRSSLPQLESQNLCRLSVSREAVLSREPRTICEQKWQNHLNFLAWCFFMAGGCLRCQLVGREEPPTMGQR